MADAEEDAVAAAVRLEAALDRLAEAAARPRAQEPVADPRTREVAQRLDALIAQLRGVLSGSAPE